MNQAVVGSQHSQQQQQQHHIVANGGGDSSNEGGNRCNAHQNGQGLMSVHNIRKDIEGGQSAILGHKISDKTSRFDDYYDVKLEYMDLEEFLVENELPVDSVFDEQQNMDEEHRRKLLVQPQQLNAHHQLLQQDQFHRRSSANSETHQQPLQSPDHLVTSIQQQMHHHQTNDEQQNTNRGCHPQQLHHHQQHPSLHSSNQLVSSSQQPPSSARESVGSPPTPRLTANTSLGAQQVISSSSVNVPSSGNCLRGPTTNGTTTSSNDHIPQITIKSESRESASRAQLDASSSASNTRLDSGIYDTSEEDKLLLSTVSRTACSPDGISPRVESLDDEMCRYSFADEDVKPPRELMHGSPISSSGSTRKKRKFSITEDNKDDRYWERRRKNNMAAKRSRDARRAKENQIAMKATFYERENKVLTQELGKARAEIHLLRERLCKYEMV